jgi:hypothetical protein
MTKCCAGFLNPRNSTPFLLGLVDANSMIGRQNGETLFESSGDVVDLLISKFARA